MKESTGIVRWVNKRIDQQKTFEDLFKDFKGFYDMGEVDWGAPRGAEE